MQLKNHIVLLFFVLIFFSVKVRAQSLTMDISPTPEEMVAFICGNGVDYFNVTYNGADIASGLFGNGTPCGLGIESGVILTSGKAEIAIGADPNNPGTNASNGSGYSNNLGGDPDLNNVYGGNTRDACVLEFDFIPQSDTIQLNFAFGSDEYPEYIYRFNDIFAFFVTGPNPNGGNYDKVNIAKIPGTNSPVSIDSVNRGCTPIDDMQCDPPRPSSHPIYFKKNYYNNPSFPFEYDGITFPITAYIQVVPCATYHIKFAVADEMDHSFDTGVFLEANSFSSPVVNIDPQYSTPLDSAFAVEGCTQANVVFEIPEISPDTTWIYLDAIYGTATNGVDFPYVSDTVFIPPGETSDTIYIQPFYDPPYEGIETFVFEYDNDPCQMNAEVYTIKIADFQEVDLPDDTTACDGVPIILDSGMDYMGFLWNTGATTRTITAVNPGLYYVTVNNYGCPDSDSVYVQHFPKPPPTSIYHD